MRVVALVSVAVVLVAAPACRGDDPTGTAPGATTKTSATSAVTVRYDPGGGKTKVDGATLHGDPKVCGALKSCCTVPALSLFCGLSQAGSNGDCAKSLKEVKAYAAESHVATPAGCN